MLSRQFGHRRTGVGSTAAGSVRRRVLRRRTGLAGLLAAVEHESNSTGDEGHADDDADDDARDGAARETARLLLAGLAIPVWGRRLLRCVRGGRLRLAFGPGRLHGVVLFLVGDLVLPDVELALVVVDEQVSGGQERLAQVPDVLVGLAVRVADQDLAGRVAEADLVVVDVGVRRDELLVGDGDLELRVQGDGDVAAEDGLLGVVQQAVRAQSRRVSEVLAPEGGLHAFDGVAVKGHQSVGGVDAHVPVFGEGLVLAPVGHADVDARHVGVEAGRAVGVDVHVEGLAVALGLGFVVAAEDGHAVHLRRLSVSV